MRNRYGIQEPAPKHRYRIQWHGSLAACDVLASTPGEARYKVFLAQKNRGVDFRDFLKVTTVRRAV